VNERRINSDCGDVVSASAADADLRRSRDVKPGLDIGAVRALGFAIDATSGKGED